MVKHIFFHLGAFLCEDGRKFKIFPYYFFKIYFSQRFMFKPVSSFCFSRQKWNKDWEIDVIAERREPGQARESFSRLEYCRGTLFKTSWARADLEQKLLYNWVGTLGRPPYVILVGQQDEIKKILKKHSTVIKSKLSPNLLGMVVFIHCKLS